MRERPKPGWATQSTDFWHSEANRSTTSRANMESDDMTITVKTIQERLQDEARTMAVRDTHAILRQLCEHIPNANGYVSIPTVLLVKEEDNPRTHRIMWDLLRGRLHVFIEAILYENNLDDLTRSLINDMKERKRTTETG